MAIRLGLCLERQRLAIDPLKELSLELVSGESFGHRSQNHRPRSIEHERAHDEPFRSRAGHEFLPDKVGNFGRGISHVSFPSKG